MIKGEGGEDGGEEEGDGDEMVVKEIEYDLILYKARTEREGKRGREPSDLIRVNDIMDIIMVWSAVTVQ